MKYKQEKERGRKCGNVCILRREGEGGEEEEEFEEKNAKGREGRG